MKKSFILLCITVTLFVFIGCTAKKEGEKWALYQGPDFSVEYNSAWTINSKGNILFFYLSKKSNINIQALDKSRYKNKEAVIDSLAQQMSRAKNSKILDRKSLQIGGSPGLELKTTYEYSNSPHTQNSSVVEGKDRFYLLVYTSWYDPIKQKGDEQVEELLQQSEIFKHNEYNKYLKDYYRLLKSFKLQ